MSVQATLIVATGVQPGSNALFVMKAADGRHSLVLTPTRGEALRELAKYEGTLPTAEYEDTLGRILESGLPERSDEPVVILQGLMAMSIIAAFDVLQENVEATMPMPESPIWGFYLTNELASEDGIAPEGLLGLQQGDEHFVYVFRSKSACYGALSTHYADDLTTFSRLAGSLAVGHLPEDSDDPLICFHGTAGKAICLALVVRDALEYLQEPHDNES